MKKNRLFIGFISLVSLLAITGCNSNNGKKEAHKIELVRQLVDAMSVDQSSYLANGFKTSFVQDYEVSYNTNSETTDIEYSLKHSSRGEFSRFYEQTVNDSQDNRFNDGKGYFAGQQVESVDFIRKVTDKKTDTVENRKANYDFNHNFGIKYDSTHLSVSGASTLNNKLRASNNASNEFKGIISKDLIGGYSNTYLDSVVDDVLYLDAWDEVFTFINYRMDYYQTHVFDSDDSIKGLINDLSLDVSEDSSRISVSFKIKSSKAIKDLYNKETTDAGFISGSIYINKATKRIDSYEYDLRNYFDSILSFGSQNKDQYIYKVNNFKVTGLNLNTMFDSLNITGPLNEYNSENASMFSKSFNEIIIPHVDNVLVIE